MDNTNFTRPWTVSYQSQITQSIANPRKFNRKQYIYMKEKNEIQNAEKETKRKIPKITKFKKSGIYYNKYLPKLD